MGNMGVQGDTWEYSGYIGVQENIWEYRGIYGSTGEHNSSEYTWEYIEGIRIQGET